MRQPLGVAVVGGLCLSQLLTLYITPVVYIYLDGLDRILKRRLDPPKEELPEEEQADSARSLPSSQARMRCSMRLIGMRGVALRAAAGPHSIGHLFPSGAV